MSKEDIEKAQRDAEAHAEDDKRKKEAIEAKNHLENAIYQAEKMPDEFKDKISAEDQDSIKKAVEDAKSKLKDNENDKDALEAAAKELNDRIMPIGAKLYQQSAEANQSASNATGDANTSDAGANDGPVEGEVVDK